MLESFSAATDLGLISYLKAIPDARMRRGVRIPAWYLPLVAVLGILSRCQSLRDLERFAISHHSALTATLGIELRRPPSDSAFRYFFQHVDVAVLRQLLGELDLVGVVIQADALHTQRPFFGSARSRGPTSS